MVIETITDRQTWDDFVQNRHEANCLQSWSIMLSHQEMGQPIVRRAVYRDNQILGVYSGFVDRAKKGTGLIIAGGPLINLVEKKAINLILTDMRNQAKALGCDFVRLRPQWPDSPESREVLKTNGAQKAPFYLSVEHAGVLDISGTEQEIVSQFRQKARRAIRKAESAALDLTISQDPADIDQFHAIELDHAKRQGYVPFSKKFLKTQFQAFVQNNEAQLFIAKKGREVLAENFIVFYGHEASYLYGVSTRLGLEYSAAPLLHLLAIREAKKRGLTRYNFWGIVDETDTKHRFYGVSVFKRGFGVAELKYTPAHDLIINPLRYHFLIKPLETIRRRLRKV
ncbi:peptidoglycan bridge formation glycyltransferase FemA/FemB family protein [Candidatus Saccharibacteria bacterium]|nr:peptidoglycan bridge formation glycyltransferase FemA/FemB family protein [Candidatus Saccharibacteria bacterium]